MKQEKTKDVRFSFKEFGEYVKNKRKAMQEQEITREQNEYTVKITKEFNKNGALRAVERSIYYNGKQEYSDRLTFPMWDYTLANPDIFRELELFTMGMASLHGTPDRRDWDFKQSLPGGVHPFAHENL